MVSTREYRTRAEKQETTKSEMQLMIFELCNEVDSLRRVADKPDDARRYAHLTAARREVVDIGIAAAHLRVTEKTIRNYVSSGVLPAYRLAGNKLLRFDMGDLNALLVPVPRGDFDALGVTPAPKKIRSVMEHDVPEP